MGKDKKHKRHKSDRKEKYEELPVSRPPVAGSSPGSGLRLVLKMGMAEPEQEMPPAVAPLRLSMAAITEAETQRKEKKHKKKKKKDKERDREYRERHRVRKERRHLEAVWSAGMEELSRLSSSTEPFSQGTGSSPERRPPSEPAPPNEPSPAGSPSPLPAGRHAYPSQSAEYSRRYGQADDDPDQYHPAHPSDQYHTAHPPDQYHSSRPPNNYHPAHVPDEYYSPHQSGYPTEPYHPAHAPEQHHSTHPPEQYHSTTLPDSYRMAQPPEPYPSTDPTAPYPSAHPSEMYHSAHPPAPYGSVADPQAVYVRPPRNSLQRFLEYLLRGLEKKDTQRFFRAPVTDLLAPGYSNVITHPMDFSTMLAKIEANVYATLAEFQSDFRLMCSNAMAYNRADTIYFKAAKRLLHIGSKMMAPEKLISLRTVVPAMLELGAEVLGFEVLPPPLPASAAPPGSLVSGHQFSEPDPVDEEAQAEEILKQAQEAARRAAEKVANSRKAPKLGFLRRRPDGSTVMAVLTPSDRDRDRDQDRDGDQDRDEDGNQPQQERPIAPGVMTGRMSQGSGLDRRSHQAKPVRPVYYGIYGSFGPWYDSTFATISQEESELLAQTYGGEMARQYAQSVCQFADGCELATQMMDNLLDILTSGRHRRARPRLDQYGQLAREERLVNTALAAAVPAVAPPAGPPLDLAALRALDKHGIDVTFVDALEAQERGERAAQCRLERTSELLVSLSELQRRRLSSQTQPSQREAELAEALAASLTSLAGQSGPGGQAVTPVVAKRGPAAASPDTPGRRGPAAASPDNPSSHEEVDVEAVSTAATPEVRPVDTPPAAAGLPQLMADV